VVIALLVSLAVAEEPAEPEDIEEITVYAEEQVRRAKQRVVEDLEVLGYDQVARVGDREVYRHSEPWKGEVVLHDDGFSVVRRQPLRVEGRKMPWTAQNTPVAWAGCLIYPWACVRIGGAMISTAKWRAVEGRTVDQIHGDVSTWGDRIADLHTRQNAALLPDALEALWERGVPLTEGPTLSTPAARRQAILAYWDSRTETEWGEEMRRTVEAFCRGVIERSESPFTAAELEAFNGSRRAERPFDLTRPDE
jgi:hypothetical protein